jgi:hypothetical protein
MKVKTDELRTAMRVVDNVPINLILESSQFVRIKQDGDKLTLSMTGALQAEATIGCVSQGGKWTAFVDRKIFKSFISTASDPEIEIFYKDKLTMKSGQRLDLALHAAITGYESWSPKSAFDLEDDQKSFLCMAVKYLPNIAGTENCEAIWFDKERIIVTDKIFMIEVQGSTVKQSFLLPPDVARFLASTPEKIAVDKVGVGVSISNGFLYQPKSSALDTYPIDAIKAILAEGSKAPYIFKLKADELANALKVSTQFIPDKTEGVSIQTNSGVLGITVDTGSGKFQKTVKISGTGTLASPVKIPAGKLISWLDYAGASELEYARISTAKISLISVFRFTDSSRKNCLIVADL